MPVLNGQYAGGDLRVICLISIIAMKLQFRNGNVFGQNILLARTE